MRNAFDFRSRARRRLPRLVFDFIDGGAEGEVTLRDNEAAFDRIRFRPRVLVDVSEISTAVELFGQRFQTPVILGPTGLARLVDDAGELAAARAAAAAGTTMVVSSGSSVSIAELCQAAGPQWFQLYPWADRETTEGLIASAQSAGCEVLVLTADVPVVGKRERDLRNGMSIPFRPSIGSLFDLVRRPRWLARMALGRPITFANLAEHYSGGRANAVNLAAFSHELLDPSSSWEDLAWIRERWPGKLLLKGVMCVEDAQLAREHGCDGIVVSNHGGRQMDRLPASIEALPAIAAAVGDELTILLDGGVRRGGDVLAALALGADACLIGRPWLFAAATGGEEGVSSLLELLREDIARCLALIGKTELSQLNSEVLLSAPATGETVRTGGGTRV